MSMRIGILGPLEVRDAAGQVLPIGGARLRSLLIRLAISDGHSVPVDRLAADLWPDGGGPADAGNAVQALVSRLRGAAGRDIVEYGPTGYRVTVPSCEVDAWAFEELVADARARLVGGGHAEAADLLRHALALWRGPALADVADASFATATIARLSELKIAATEDRIDADLALGRGAELVPEVEELATGHPLRERLRGQLMRTLYAAGRQADALGVFEDTRHALADALGVDPSPGLAAVHLAILRGELPIGPSAQPAALPGSRPGPPVRPGSPPARPGSPPARPGSPPARPGSPPARPGSPPGSLPPAPAPEPAALPQWRRGNLPAQLTSFVGRSEELNRVGELFAESRLITLTGPGGAGKTRLSIELGASVQAEVPDGVWFVPLAPVRDAIDVPQAVLKVIGAHDAGWLADPVEAARLAAMEPLDRLADVLAGLKLVLVLDNCEHVLDAVAWLAGRVLADAPGVRILATSREPLGLTGERLSPVPSLPLPPPEADAQQAAANPSMRLFADRAAAVRPGFAIDADTAGPVARICRALDGIPLAIELAAARVRALTPAQVADRLDDRFALLSVGTRGTLPRHQTLRAIVDWSWELLNEAERTVLRRLSVFSGGATPDSAEEVCSLGGPSGHVVDVVASLVDKSLVTATGEQEVRYRLLETVRAYAADRLAEAGETGRAADAHAQFFLGLAELAEPELRNRNQLTWLDRLAAEHDNFSAALHHVIAAGDIASALRFLQSLCWFWIMRDYDTEAGEWAAEILPMAGDAAPAGLEDALAICKIIATMGRSRDDAHGGADQLKHILKELAPPHDPKHPLLTLATPMLAVLNGDRDGARRGLEAVADHPDPWVRAARQGLGGHLALNEGNIEQGAEELGRGYDMFREQGDRWGQMICLTGLAEVAIAQARPGDAVRAYEEARGLATEGLATNWSQTIRVPLGRARALAGDMAGARADLEQGVASAERLGEFDDVAMGYVQLSEMARAEGDLAAARAKLQHALDVVEPRLQRPDMSAAATIAYSRTGCLAEQQGDLEAAAEWHRRALGTLTGSMLPVMPGNPIATAVEGVAALAAARGEHARAAELLGLAHTVAGFSDPYSLEVKRVTAAIGTGLSEADFEAAYARGRNLTRADALALVP
jgi:predicted ATPase/DNA-binding SARP family transcriptional activator